MVLDMLKNISLLVHSIDSRLVPIVLDLAAPHAVRLFANETTEIRGQEPSGEVFTEAVLISIPLNDCALKHLVCLFTRHYLVLLDP